MTHITARQDDETTIASQLMIVQDQIAALPDLGPHADAIAEELQDLFTKGVNAEQLQTIHDSALTLLDTAEQQDAALRGVMEIARQLQDQRDQTRDTLEELREALDDCDTSVDEIGELYDMIEGEAFSNACEYFQDTRFEHDIETVINATPLSEDETRDILNILFSEVNIDPDDLIWDELRAWIARAKEVMADGAE